MGIQHLAPSLFECTSTISGLTYLPNFITTEEQTNLIRIINTQPWISDLKRRVQHYGYRYDYKLRSVASNLKLGNIPLWLLSLCERLQREGWFECLPDQAIINEYQPGQGIAAHVDCVPCFDKTIASVSFGSGCLMDFQHKSTGQKFEQFLEPGSLVVLSDDARYEWRHGIAPRKTDKINGLVFQRSTRLSITFRKVRSIT